MKNPVVFASGSCRLLNCFDPAVQNKAGIPSQSLHHFNNYWKGGSNFLGKLHTARQHLTLLKFLHYEIDLTEERQHKLLSMSFLSDWSKSYREHCPNYCYHRSLENIRSRLYDCRVFIFEICSMKNAYYPDDGVPIQGEMDDGDAQLVRYKSVEECRRDVVELVEYVSKTFYYPTIILVGHIRNWIFNPEHAHVEERQQIYEILVEMDQKYENVFYVDPAAFLSNKDLLDDWHYDQEGKAGSVLYQKMASLWEPRF